MPIPRAIIHWSLLATLCLLTAACSEVTSQKTFTNPLLPTGPDPWVTRHNGYYYYSNTRGDRIALRKTRYMARVSEAKPVTVWRAPASGPNSRSVWAPELHRIDHKWYLYYTAANKAHDDDAHRHIFVLENDAEDPTRGKWINKGMVNTDRNGIDATVFQWRDQLYLVYSAYVGDHSDLIIARMSNPWTLSGRQVDIARPTYSWEMQGGRKILEAPEFLAGPGNKIFLTYSASACWSDDYALGMLTAGKNASLLDASSWHKSPRPVFAKSAANGVYAPGHNGFFKSPDGTQDWIIYHANPAAGIGCGTQRSPRMQQFHWNADGTPEFGKPVPTGKPLKVPSR
jgi:GH43 family beta-xylosidase